MFLQLCAAYLALVQATDQESFDGVSVENVTDGIIVRKVVSSEGGNSEYQTTKHGNIDRRRAGSVVRKVYNLVEPEGGVSEYQFPEHESLNGMGADVENTLHGSVVRKLRKAVEPEGGSRKDLATKQESLQGINFQDLHDDGVKHSKSTEKRMAECDFGGLSYALFIDGKDSSKGEFAYGQLFLSHILSAYEHVVKTTQQEINVEYVKSLQRMAEWTSNKTGFRNRIKVMSELSCMKVVKNETFKNAIVHDLYPNIVDITYNPDDSIDTILPRLASNLKIQNFLRSMIDQYNHDQRQAGGTQQQLKVLARFLRSLAWLHPFPDGNGRTRTLLLQHELRRLQLGCGAMMFNNNADIYFDSSEIYARKMLEGISAAEYALSDGRNPWDDAHRRKHRDAFPLHDVTSACRYALESNTKSVFKVATAGNS
jgi:hypothetical protein